MRTSKKRNSADTAESAPRKEEKSLLGRRRYLQYSAAVAATAVGLNAIPTEASAADYDTVVNVAEAGGDTTGQEPIDNIISNNLRDNTLIVFPDGRYSMGQFRTEPLTNFGMVAADGATPTIVPKGPVSEVGGYFLTLRGTDLRLEGIEFDYTQSGYGGRVECIGVGGRFVCRNVTIRGRNDGSGTFRWDVRDPNGEGLVENVSAPDGGDTFGMFVGREHAGVLTIRDCNVESFNNNGLYASAPGHGGHGEVHVEGGLFRNNNIAGVRLGSEGSYVKGATVVVDGEVPDYKGIVNARGIRFRDKGNQYAEDCDVIIETARGGGGIVFEGDALAADVRNCRVRLDTDNHRAAINCKTTNQGGDVGPRFENVSVTGSASDTPGALVIDRPGTTFDGCCFQLSGSNQPGIVFKRSDGSVTNTSINVDGKAIDVVDSNVTTDNVTSGDTCPLPSKERKEYGSTEEEPTPSPSAPNEIEITTPDSSTIAEYSFTVDGDLEAVDTNSEDEVSGSSATGAVAGGVDRYRYSGSIVELTIDAGGLVYVNGEEFTFDDGSTDGTTDGSTDGTTDGSTDGTTDGSTDGTTDGSTDGTTDGSTDGTTDGSTDGTTDGSTDGTTDGELPNYITFDGSSSSGVTGYSFSVSGELQRSVELSNQGSSATEWDQIEDPVEGNEAYGVVANGVDGYRFSGNLTHLEVRGDAVVSFSQDG